MGEGSLLKLAMEIGAILGGGAWLGRLQYTTNRNTTDLHEIRNKLEQKDKEAQQQDDKLHILSERIAVLETKSDAQTAILIEIRDRLPK